MVFHHFITVFPTFLIIITITLIIINVTATNGVVEQELRIFYTGGIYGGIMPLLDTPDCHATPSTCQEITTDQYDSLKPHTFGGCLQRSAFFKAMKLQHENSLILDSGSYSFSSLFSLNIPTRCINESLYDAINTGVTDLYLGTDNYYHFIQKIDPKIDVISSNIVLDPKFEPYLTQSRTKDPITPAILPYSLKTLPNGITVAVIGVILPNSLDLPAASTVKPRLEHGESIVFRLQHSIYKAQDEYTDHQRLKYDKNGQNNGQITFIPRQIDLVVMLTDMMYESAVQIAKQVNGINIIISFSALDNVYYNGKIVREDIFNETLQDYGKLTANGGNQANYTLDSNALINHVLTVPDPNIPVYSLNGDNLSNNTNTFVSSGNRDKNETNGLAGRGTMGNITNLSTNLASTVPSTTTNDHRSSPPITSSTTVSTLQYAPYTMYSNAKYIPYSTGLHQSNINTYTTLSYSQHYARSYYTLSNTDIPAQLSLDNELVDPPRTHPSNFNTPNLINNPSLNNVPPSNTMIQPGNTISSGVNISTTTPHITSNTNNSQRFPIPTIHSTITNPTTPSSTLLNAIPSNLFNTTLITPSSVTIDSPISIPSFVNDQITTPTDPTPSSSNSTPQSPPGLPPLSNNIRLGYISVIENFYGQLMYGASLPNTPTTSTVNEIVLKFTTPQQTDIVPTLSSIISNDTSEPTSTSHTITTIKTNSTPTTPTHLTNTFHSLSLLPSAFPGFRDSPDLPATPSSTNQLTIPLSISTNPFFVPPLPTITQPALNTSLNTRPETRPPLKIPPIDDVITTGIILNNNNIDNNINNNNHNNDNINNINNNNNHNNIDDNSHGNTNPSQPPSTIPRPPLISVTPDSPATTYKPQYLQRYSYLSHITLFHHTVTYNNTLLPLYTSNATLQSLPTTPSPPIRTFQRPNTPSLITDDTTSPNTNLPPNQSLSSILSSLSILENDLLTSSEILESKLLRVIGTIPSTIPYRISSTPPGTLPTLSNFGCDNFECQLGNLVVQSYRLACIQYNSKLCDIAFVNSGSMFAPLYGPEVTLRGLRKSFPFNNMVVIIEVVGEIIKKALQRSAENQGTTGYLHTNLHTVYSVNSNLQSAERLVEFKLPRYNIDFNPKTAKYLQELMKLNKITDHTITPSVYNEILQYISIQADQSTTYTDFTSTNTPNLYYYDEINENSVYTVALPLFLYNGGDGYSMFNAASPIKNENVVQEVELLQKYFSILPAQAYLPHPNDAIMERCLINAPPLVTMSEKRCSVVTTMMSATDATFCVTDVGLCNQMMNVPILHEFGILSTIQEYNNKQLQLFAAATSLPTNLTTSIAHQSQNVTMNEDINDLSPNESLESSEQSQQTSPFDTFSLIVTCSSCSGLGLCQHRSCQCFKPTHGLFKDMDVILGPSCNYIASIWTSHTAIKVIFYIIAIGSILVCVFYAACLMLYSSHPAIRAISPRFAVIMCFGGLIASIGAMLNIEPYHYGIPCMVSVWLLTLGYILTFGTLFLRTFRLFKIFHKKNTIINPFLFTDGDVFKRLLIFVGVDILILSCFQFADPMAYIPKILSQVSISQTMTSNDVDFLANSNIMETFSMDSVPNLDTDDDYHDNLKNVHLHNSGFSPNWLSSFLPRLTSHTTSTLSVKPSEDELYTYTAASQIASSSSSRHKPQYHRGHEYVVTCQTKSSIPVIILLVYNGLLLAWGLYLAFRTRHLDVTFNESIYISISIYNCAIVSLVMCIVQLVLSEKNPLVAMIIYHLGTLFIIVFTLSVIYLPRLRLVYLYSADQQVDDNGVLIDDDDSNNNKLHNTTQNSNNNSQSQQNNSNIRRNSVSVVQNTSFTKPNSATHHSLNDSIEILAPVAIPPNSTSINMDDIMLTNNVSANNLSEHFPSTSNIPNNPSHLSINNLSLQNNKSNTPLLPMIKPPNKPKMPVSKLDTSSYHPSIPNQSLSDEELTILHIPPAILAYIHHLEELLQIQQDFRKDFDASLLLPTTPAAGVGWGNRLNKRHAGLKLPNTPSETDITPGALSQVIPNPSPSSLTQHISHKASGENTPSTLSFTDSYNVNNTDTSTNSPPRSSCAGGTQLLDLSNPQQLQSVLSSLQINTDLSFEEQQQQIFQQIALALSQHLPPNGNNNSNNYNSNDNNNNNNHNSNDSNNNNHNLFGLNRKP